MLVLAVGPAAVQMVLDDAAARLLVEAGTAPLSVVEQPDVVLPSEAGKAEDSALVWSAAMYVGRALPCLS